MSENVPLSGIHCLPVQKKGGDTKEESFYLKIWALKEAEVIRTILMRAPGRPQDSVKCGRY